MQPKSSRARIFYLAARVGAAEAMDETKKFLLWAIDLLRH
jgi:hypothetical protein